MSELYLKTESKMNHWPKLKAEVDKILLKDPLVKAGKMFGYPAYYVNGKLAICHYDIGLAIKLPIEIVERLNNSKIVSEPFCPMGKKMGNNWVIVFPREPKEVWEMSEYLFESIAYLQGIADKAKSNTIKKKNNFK